MISSFQFAYGDQQVQAQLIFNFNAIEDVIILRPFSLNNLLGEQMMLVKGNNPKWVRLAGNLLLEPSAPMEKNLADFFSLYDFHFDLQTRVRA